MFRVPEIPIADDQAGFRDREWHTLAFEFFVEMRVSGIHFRAGDCRQVRIAQLPGPQHLAVAALEPTIFIDGHHYQALAAIAGDRNRLRQRFVLVAAEMLLELGRV